MADIADKVLDYRTKVILDSVGSPGDYEMPKSRNMLSHLTNNRACDDYQRENARKLVKKQEELLRNLAKVRLQMEIEEEEIGKTKDYYSGSREEKFGYTFDKVEKLRKQRDNRKKTEKSDDICFVASPTEGIDDEEGEKFETEIQRLRSQVNSIANRYKLTDGKEAPRYHYDSAYYPGASYVRQYYQPDYDDENVDCYYVVDDIEAEQMLDRPPKYLSADGNIYKLCKP